MNHCETAQIEALRWALDKIDDQFAKARQARAQVLPQDEDQDFDDGPVSARRGYTDEQEQETKGVD